MYSVVEVRSWLSRDPGHVSGGTLRRVIRHSKTGEFFSAGTWTLSSALAQDFPDTRELLTTCAQYQLRDVEVVLAVGYEPPGTYDIRIPLPLAD